MTQSPGGPVHGAFAKNRKAPAAIDVRGGRTRALRSRQMPPPQPTADNQLLSRARVPITVFAAARVPPPPQFENF